MTKAQLVDAVAARSGLSRKQSAEAIDAANARIKIAVMFCFMSTPSQDYRRFFTEATDRLTQPITVDTEPRKLR